MRRIVWWTRLRQLGRSAKINPAQMTKPLEYAGNTVVVFNEAMSFFGNVATIATLLFAVGGTVSVGRNTTFVLDVNTTSLPLRLLVLLLIGAALGWALGWIVTSLTRVLTEAKRLIAVIFAVAAGILLVLSADWLALEARRSALPELHLFTCIGLGLALWVARFQFSRYAREASKIAVNWRAQSLFTFTFVAILALALTMLGAR